MRAAYDPRARRPMKLPPLPALRPGPLLWCVPLLVACLAWQLAGSGALDVAVGAGPDVMRGFYEPEIGPSGAFRWSSRDAALTLPARPRPAVLELRGAVAPDGTRVTVGLGDRAAVELPPSPGALSPRRYLLLWPGGGDSLGLARVALAATPPEVTVDSRPLGIALSAVALRPLRAGPGLPPPSVLLALVLLPPLLAVCLRATGLGALSSRALAVALVTGAWLASFAQPLAVQPLLLDLQVALSAPVLRWAGALLLLGLAGLPITAFLLRTLPLRGLLFARGAALVLVGWACWYASAVLRAPFGPPTVLAVALLLVASGAWALRSQGLRELGRLVRRRWRALVAAEVLFHAALLAGLWLRWNGAVGPALTGTEKPMDLALLQGVLRDPALPPPDLWLAGYDVNYYYLGYVKVAAVAHLAGVTPGEAFNLGVATLFALTAAMVAGLVATLVRLELGPEPPAAAGRSSDARRSWFAARPRSYVAAALLGAALVLLAGNQMGALQLILGGSQPRVLDGGQLAEALWQRLSGAPEIRLSRPTPPAPDFGVLQGWTPGPTSEFDWWSPSRIVLDDLPAAEGVERRHAITEFPFFSFYLGDLHPYLLALPHGLLALALALAALARPTVPVYLLTPRGWLELALTGAALGGIYAVNAWDAPGWWLVFFGALALLYLRLASAPRPPAPANPQPKDEQPPASVSSPAPPSVVGLWSSVAGLWSLVASRWSSVVAGLAAHFLQTSLALGAAMLVAVAPFASFYRAPFGATDSQPWEGVPLLAPLGRALGPAPDHTRLHVFLMIFALFLLPLLALAASQPRRRPERALWLVTGLTLLVGQLLGFPLLALLPLALTLAALAWRAAHRPATALTLWAAAVGALILLAADTVYVRDPLEAFMPRYNTVFKFYFQVWVLWGALAAFALWRFVTFPQAQGEGRSTMAEGRAWGAIAWLRPAALALFALLLAGALVYPVETLRRGDPFGPPAREVDGLAFLDRRAPGDAAAIRWLQANTTIADVIVTAWCECEGHQIGYTASAGGVPTLLGQSGGHERMWRSGWPPWIAEIAARERDIPRIYETTDVAETRELLARYGVDYVFVGVAERDIHAGPGLEKFDTFLEPVFSHRGARIYRVPPQP